ncbi:DUF4129 domain-containing transglutaminase family protein [Phycisphaera mikurensis]|uniref:Transglutaminase-like domain-containing protein n=1 Tax=Phycisphaera mikurensis (strain NBRC 102666 / KCTC 22515 / FYK2301M01) TaxID=1142394 RepID=I0IJ25_PHYMF|nr:transglutaminase domain-containing protein [Phycisphaera mikurensis]MBB6443110.1 transglutaminase-like putative cysteine protease [Phycisphaera mikurensis]BAM05263.1 hypothetical protein PSMK_31040 [Phycisphaera mikurensis NBRC 102666]
MTLTRSTRRLLDAQALLGVGCLAIAERNAAFAVLAFTVYAAVRACHRLGDRSPLPLRPAWVNAGALVAVGVMILETRRPGMELVVAMGHFTAMLQGMLLLSRRTTRDEALLLVLGLIQVLAASTLSSTVLDGVAMMAWCAVAAAALTRLSMRASVERIAARNARLGGGAIPPPPTPVAPRMGRAFAAGVVVAALVASAVFVATPRREGGTRGDTARTLGGLRGTGFAARVDLGVAPPTRDLGGPVLHVTLRQDGSNIGRDGRDFLLRGAALDRYEPESRSWVRSAAMGREDVLLRLPPEAAGALVFASGAALNARPSTHWSLEATQRGAPLDTLFLPTSRLMAAGTPLRVRIDGLRSLGFNPIDRRLQSIDRDASPLEAYEATVVPLREAGLAEAYDRFLAPPPEASPGPGGRGLRRGGEAPAGGAGRRPHWLGWLRPITRVGGSLEAGAASGQPADPGGESRRWEVQPARVAALAQNVLAAAGLERDPAAGPLPDDRRRVERLENFLRTHCDYTLQNPPAGPGEDPVIAFLFERRRGHCELFAAGLVALCRSVGIPARVATGYRAGEFNAVGGYYVVRQEHAHAWAEVALGPPLARPGGGPPLPTGWTTYDATPPALVRAEHRRAGPPWLRQARHLLEHAEYTWISRVVAFDPQTRARAFAALRNAGVSLLSDRLGWTRWVPVTPRWRAAVAGGAVVLSVLACLLAWGILRRHRGFRRRARSRPAAFDAGEGGAAVRRFGFYARLLELLERRGLERPASETPAAWAEALARQDPDAYGGVVEVTAAFYAARFGGLEPDADARRRIEATLDRLASGPGNGAAA